MSDNYLTMARIMKRETKKYLQKNLPSNPTGWQIINTERAFKDGFMAGFEARFFNDEGDSK